MTRGFAARHAAEFHRRKWPKVVYFVGQPCGASRSDAPRREYVEGIGRRGNHDIGTEHTCDRRGLSRQLQCKARNVADPARPIAHVGRCRPPAVTNPVDRFRITPSLRVALAEVGKSRGLNLHVAAHPHPFPGKIVRSEFHAVRGRRPGVVIDQQQAHRFTMRIQRAWPAPIVHVVGPVT